MLLLLLLLLLLVVVVVVVVVVVAYIYIVIIHAVDILKFEEPLPVEPMGIIGQHFTMQSTLWCNVIYGKWK